MKYKYKVLYIQAVIICFWSTILLIKIYIQNRCHTQERVTVLYNDFERKELR